MPDIKVKGYTAFAPFVLEGKSYKAGDVFALPAGYERDAAHDEFRSMGKKADGNAPGLTFSTAGGKKVILPVKE